MYTATPGTSENVIGLLVAELRWLRIYPSKKANGLTAHEKVYRRGQARLRSDHTGDQYNYDVYQEDPPYVPDKGKAGSAEGAH